MHTMKLLPTPYAMIQSGRKTIELRLDDQKRRQIRVGDGIVFTNTQTGQSIRKISVRILLLPETTRISKYFWIRSPVNTELALWAMLSKT